MNAPADRSLAKFTAERITDIRPWSERLFSFRTTRFRGFRFVAGQFARLGVPADGGEIVWRAYSMVSAPYDEHLEFYSIVVPGGAFTERLARLRAGDEVFVEKTSYGFLTADRFAAAPKTGLDLWLLASGTGIAPFVSILADPDTWERFARVVVVHSARHEHELAYRERFAELHTHPLVGPLVGDPAAGRLRYVPVVTRDAGYRGLGARIPVLVADGRLEDAAGLALDIERSRIMVCGNPDMLADVRAGLGARGFRVDRRKTPGQMAFENYW